MSKLGKKLIAAANEGISIVSQKAKRSRSQKVKGKNLRRLRRIRSGHAAAPLPDRRVYDPPKNLRIAVDTIQDPYGVSESAKKLPRQNRDGSPSTGEGEWVSTGQPEILVLRSIRTDPIGWMKSHNQLDESEFLAGRRWQSLYERSHVGSVQAVDTSKEPVDGGKFPELLTDNQRIAIEQLRLASYAIVKSVPGDMVRGRARIALIQDVLADGMFIRAAASRRGISADRAVSALAKEFHQCLAIMAEHFGFIGTSSKNKSKIRGWRKSDGEEENKGKSGSQKEEAGKVQNG